MLRTHGRRVGKILMLGLCALLSGGIGAAESALFVRVKVDTANLREGPGVASRRLREARVNEPFRVVGRTGAWLKVADFERHEGWIHGSLTDREPAAVVTARQVNVRSGPGTRHPVVFTAERGVNFRVLDEEGRWVFVEHEDGDRGWVHGSLVWGKW